MRRLPGAENVLFLYLSAGYTGVCSVRLAQCLAQVQEIEAIISTLHEFVSG